MSSGPVLGIAGGSGLVGERILFLLRQRRHRLGGLRLWSRRPESVRGLPWLAEVPVTRAGPGEVEACDIVLHAGPARSGRELGERAEAAGVAFVDLSEAWRLDPGTPLVLPELLEDGRLPASPNRRWAIPNCTVTGPALVLVPLARRYGLRRVSLTTLQAVSGMGRRALQAHLDSLDSDPSEAGGRPDPPPGLPRAGDILPWCGGLPEEGTSPSPEERSVEEELRRLLAPHPPVIEASCLRTSLPRGHGATLWVETERPQEDPRGFLAGSAPGVVLARDPAPTPGAGTRTDVVLAGRVRWDPSAPRRLGLWLAWDNLVRGAALPAVRILELLDAELRG